MYWAALPVGTPDAAAAVAVPKTPGCLVVVAVVHTDGLGSHQAVVQLYPGWSQEVLKRLVGVMPALGVEQNLAKRENWSQMG